MARSQQQEELEKECVEALTLSGTNADEVSVLLPQIRQPAKVRSCADNNASLLHLAAAHGCMGRLM